MARRTVVVGFLGSTLDAAGGAGSHRWDRWRPTVSVCRHEDLLVDRLELLVPPRNVDLAGEVEADIRTVSPETELRCHTFDVGDLWDFEAVFEALYDFASELDLDEERDDCLVHISTGTHVAQICLFLLTESRHLPGRLLQTSPPRRKTEPGIGRYQIIDLDLARYDRIATRFAEETSESLTFLKAGIETRNAAFNRLIEDLERVAVRSRAPILLAGPTGAGKTQLARRIFELKRSRGQVAGRLVEVNCATLRGDAAMSTLFGHVKGAFTGAVSDRPGVLRGAHGGVLFLDEIGELGVDEQAMLLRALEDKRFLPVGADEEVESDFQLLAGTNRDLGAAVGEGRFRDDLLARIDLWTFQLPGLAERIEDIEPNLRFELDRFARGSGHRITFNREAREVFLEFAVSPRARWSGNFRDLGAALTRMATLAPSGRIGVDDVRAEIDRLANAWRRADEGEPSSAHDPVREILGSAGAEAIDPFDRVQLAEVLRVLARARSLSEAGRELFAVSRKRKRSSNDTDRLRKYLARFGLRWQDGRVVAAERE